MAINWQDNKLTKEIESTLKQGSKVKFKWHGSDSEYTGRIEVNENDNQFYFVNEFNYKGDVLIHEGMRFYNPLERFFHFTMFEVL